MQYINLHVAAAQRLKLIPYIFHNENTFLYFNHILKRSKDSLGDDAFKTSLPTFAQSDPESIWEKAIAGPLSILSSNFLRGLAQLTGLGQSARQYLSSKGFSFGDVNWLETFVDATGRFDLDVAEIVLEDWFFGAGQSNVSWVTIEGGMSRMIEAMVSCLTTPVKYSQRVDAIQPISATTVLNVHTKAGRIHRYSHVINTASLGATQEMDLRALHLDDEQNAAIRLINYDAAMKIGIKFKSRWWQDLPQPIQGGQSLSDLPIRTCVYPSYGVNTPGAAAVLIASYVVLPPPLPRQLHILAFSQRPLGVMLVHQIVHG